MAVDTGVKPSPVVRRRHGLLLLCEVVLMSLVAIAAISFEGEGQASGVSGDTHLADGIRIHANLEEMNPGDPQVVIQLDFEPRDASHRTRSSWPNASESSRSAAPVWTNRSLPAE